MKALCFSDSHGSKYGMRKALSLHSDAEVVFFLGDGLSDAYELSLSDNGRMWIPVRGNCDITSAPFSRDIPKVDSITLMDKRIVLTHGDLYGAKYGDGRLIYLAREMGADVLLFGHTHTAYEKYYDIDKPLYLFNPGSISGRGGSYGVINIFPSGIAFSHGNV